MCQIVSGQTIQALPCSRGLYSYTRQAGLLTEVVDQKKDAPTRSAGVTDRRGGQRRASGEKKGIRGDRVRGDLNHFSPRSPRAHADSNAGHKVNGQQSRMGKSEGLPATLTTTAGRGRETRAVRATGDSRQTPGVAARANSPPGVAAGANSPPGSRPRRSGATRGRSARNRARGRGRRRSRSGRHRRSTACPCGGRRDPTRGPPPAGVRET